MGDVQALQNDEGEEVYDYGEEAEEEEEYGEEAEEQYASEQDNCNSGDLSEGEANELEDGTEPD